MCPMRKIGPNEDGQAEMASTEHQIVAPPTLGGHWEVCNVYSLLSWLLHFYTLGTIADYQDNDPWQNGH